MTFTKEEQLQAVYDLKVGYTLGHADIAILKGLARMALAGMEAEPVSDEHIRREVNVGGNTWVQCSKHAFDKAKTEGKIVRELCERPQPLTTSERAELESARLHIAELEAAPPATVGDGDAPLEFLPDFPGKVMTQRECYRAGFEAGKAAGVKEGWMTVPVKPTAEMVAAAMLSNDVLFDQEDDTMFRVQHGAIWRAMLAAAPDFREIGNSSTKLFRENSETSTNCPCWCRTCRPVKMNDMRFVVCPDCGNKRCPHANDHRNACTGSNELGQEGSAYPAAPQQELR